MKSETKNQKNENEINKQEDIKIKFEKKVNFKRTDTGFENFLKNNYNPDKKELYEKYEKSKQLLKEGIENLNYRHWKNKNMKEQAAGKLLNFESNRGFENFKFQDKKAKQLKKENDINGISEKKQFRTMKKFTANEVAAKTFFMQKLTSSKENRLKVAQMQEDYNLGIYDKIVNKAKKEGLINDKGELLLHDRQIDLVETVESTLAIDDYLLDHLPFLEEVVIIRDNQGYPQPIVAIADGEQFQDELWFKAIENLPHLNEPMIMEYEKIPRTATMKVQRRALEQLLFNK